MEKYPTPIETLQKFKGKEIIVELKNKEIIYGELIAFDLSTNLTLKTAEGTRFIQGSSVNLLYSKEEKEATESEVKEETLSEPETPSESEAETNEETPAEEKATEEAETTEDPAEEAAEPKEAEETEVAEEVQEKEEDKTE